MAVREVNHPTLAYLENTPSSKQFLEEAKTVMPGGVTANIKHFDPHPIIMKHGKGSIVTDVDNNKYIDYLMSYGSLVTGHGHETIKQAINAQMVEDGTWLFGTPHHLEVEFGKRLQNYFPSLERLRYTNSGTEATLLALRLAAAYTGKHKVAKFEGHYHGGYDQMLVSVNPPVDLAGEEHAPNALPESKGMHESHVENTLILPFNDLNACEDLLRAHRNEIGAVMMEPVQGGIIPADVAFMRGLRKVTRELGIILIFDEVKTGFRLGLGGAQTRFDITPDLTTLGKAIGGGFPIGVVGGRKDIMMNSAPSSGADVFDSSQSKYFSAKDVLFHSGTYNGQPMILAAGMAVINILEKEINSVMEKTNRLKEGINHIFDYYGVEGGTVGIGSIFSVTLTNKEKISNYRDLQQTDLATRKEIDFRLLQKGIYTKPMNRFSVSTSHTDEDVDETLIAFDQVFQEVFEGSRF
ncbi:aspartate aminotransferase family protein [Salibacterium salarium]|uniref:Aspartate aminotransferase family protein n=1 Tax=Salibacterium salarium TaxID=284579 RepID=A0A3R9Q0S2_9BACI|nr:aspartate aminotransferase family protein [Salibacterium salarium]RSL31182.1 aspartate aminotransferase family protein [Salibacterium salarium]